MGLIFDLLLLSLWICRYYGIIQNSLALFPRFILCLMVTVSLMYSQLDIINFTSPRGVKSEKQQLAFQESL